METAWASNLHSSLWIILHWHPIGCSNFIPQIISNFIVTHYRYGCCKEMKQTFYEMKKDILCGTLSCCISCWLIIDEIKQYHTNLSSYFLYGLSLLCEASSTGILSLSCFPVVQVWHPYPKVGSKTVLHNDLQLSLCSVIFSFCIITCIKKKESVKGIKYKA